MSETDDKDATFPTAVPPQTDLDRAEQDATNANDKFKTELDRVDDLGEEKKEE